MERADWLDNISDDSLERIIPCFRPLIRRCAEGEIILTYQPGVPRSVAILRQGEARLEVLNEDGEIFLLEHYRAGDVFGELFSLPLDQFEYTVRAATDVTVLFLDYQHLIQPCEQLCEHHSQLISNLFLMTAQKSQELSLHLSILGQNSIRDKLLVYLKHIRSRSAERLPKELQAPPDRAFTIPITLGQLAEYLMVDRSAMMRTIAQMKKENLIWSKSRNFRILCDDDGESSETGKSGSGARGKNPARAAQEHRPSAAEGHRPSPAELRRPHSAEERRPSSAAERRPSSAEA